MREIDELRAQMTVWLSNLWIFEAAFVKRLTMALRDEGALSDAAIDELLARILVDCDSAMTGPDDRMQVVNLLAMTKSALADRTPPRGQRGG